MENQFNKNLRERLIRYSGNRNFTVSDDLAEEWLDSFGELVIEFMSLRAPQRRRTRSARGGGARNT